MFIRTGSGLFVRAGTGAVTSLVRGTLGRLSAYSSSPITNVDVAFDTANWTAPTGVNLGINGGELQLSGTGSNQFSRVARNTAVGARANSFLQAVASARTTGCTMAVCGRASSEAQPNDYINTRISTGFTGVNGIQTVVGLASSMTDYNSPDADLAMTQRMSLAIAEDAGGYLHGPAFEGGIISPDVTAAGHGGLLYSSGTSQSVRYSRFYQCALSALIVYGPAVDNWKIAVLNGGGSVLASANASGGVAFIDYFVERLILPDTVTLQVRDLSENVLVAEAPAERVWPGDEWTYTAGS